MIFKYFGNKQIYIPASGVIYYSVCALGQFHKCRPVQLSDFTCAVLPLSSYVTIFGSVCLQLVPKNFRIQDKKVLFLFIQRFLISQQLMDLVQGHHDLYKFVKLVQPKNPQREHCSCTVAESDQCIRAAGPARPSGELGTASQGDQNEIEKEKGNEK